MKVRRPSSIGLVQGKRLGSWDGEAKNYWLSLLPTDFGVGYRLEQFGCDGGQVYDVNLDVADLEHGEHICGCLGYLQWGHRTRCKHVQMLLKARTDGSL